jgi:F-type H+-transporting ATPase subunit delta
VSRAAVPRTYAETLLELAARDGAEEAWLDILAEVVGLYHTADEFRAFVQTPRIPITAKREVIRSAFGGRYPETFVRFLLVVLEKRRQGILPQIEQAYRELLNERTGRVQASVTLTVDPDPQLREEIQDSLSRVLGRQVMADFKRDRRLVGGMIVRVKDRVLDGSLRRRMQLLRRSLIEEGSSARQAGRS